MRKIQWLRILECLKLLKKDYEDLVLPSYFTDKKTEYWRNYLHDVTQMESGSDMCRWKFGISFYRT